MDTLLISEDEARTHLTMQDAIRAVETAFREKGRGNVEMPPKIYLSYAKYNGDIRAMPAYIENLDISGVKIVNVHPNNPKKGLPTVMATYLHIDPRTGFPLAILGASWLTAMRTGAAGAVATKYLARKNAHTLGLVGTGVQAITQALGILQVRKIEEIHAWSPSKVSMRQFAKEMEKLGIAKRVSILLCDSCEYAVRDMDVISTCTPARAPVVRAEWIRKGTHINAIGADAPGKEEMYANVLSSAKVIVDDIAQASHSGEINVPISRGAFRKSDIYCELGEVVAGKKTGRVNESEITLFDSTGLAIQDVATADMVYKKLKGKAKRMRLVV